MTGSSRRHRIAVRSACAAAGLVVWTPAVAQIADRSLSDTAQGESVGARSKANYDAVGIAVSTFRLYPSAEATLAYDDNVYDTDALRRSDVVATLAPRVELRSQSSSYDLVLSADAKISRYAKLHAEDNEQYDTAVDGRIGIGRGVGLTLGGFYGLRSELRGTLGDVVIGAPDQYNRLGGSAGVSVELVNLILSAGANVESDTYRPVRFNGTTTSLAYRDRTYSSETARASLRIGPGLRLFTQGDYNQQMYRDRSGGINRNSQGYAVVGGVEFGLTELISGEIGVGYLAQNYADGVLPAVAGVTYNGKIVWNTTRLLTLTLTGGRTLEQSPFFAPAGILEDNVELKADYELLRNLIITVSERGTFDRYRGLDRDDRLYATDVSARLLISRMFEAGLQLGHRHQSSSGIFARRYTGTSATISLTVKR